MNKCSFYRNQFSEYLDGELNDRKKTLLDEHISTCQECREALRETMAAFAQIDSLLISPCPEPDTEVAIVSIMRRIDLPTAKRTWWPSIDYGRILRMSMVVASVVALTLGFITLTHMAISPSVCRDLSIRSGHISSLTVSPQSTGEVDAETMVKRYSSVERRQEAWWPK